MLWRRPDQRQQRPRLQFRRRLVRRAGRLQRQGWLDQITAYGALNELIGATGEIATRDSGWYVMDDFTTSAASGSVPVPATALVLGIGLLALVLARRMPHRR